jgi:ABC-type arginine transport system permease subunit
MAVAIVTGLKSLVMTNGALGTCLVTSARGLPDVYVNGALGTCFITSVRGLPDVYVMDRRDGALVAVVELNSN